MQWLAFDIGGANLKVADGRGYAASTPFALWRQPEQLAAELRGMLAEAPPCDHLAVTMTGELADCFESKSAGVSFILDSVAQAAEGRRTRVYAHDGPLLTLEQAKTRAASVAAANWHALARFATRFTGGRPSLLVDVGSTTCDLIPLVDGEVATPHRTDTDRLLHGELVYAGIERTPVCALVSELPYRGQRCPIAREFFATTSDAYMLLGRLPEQPHSRDTADGRPATIAAARGRLARMICADESDFNTQDAIAAAAAVAESFAGVVRHGIESVVSNYALEPSRVILAGHGASVIQDAVPDSEAAWTRWSLASEIGPTASRCAPAHALAVLAREAVIA